MKTTFSAIAILSSLFLLVLSFNSCKDDPCDGVLCLNGNYYTADDQCTCACFNGWSGVDCTIENKCITRITPCPGNTICDSITGDCVPIDPCITITCQNGGSCNSLGNCDCPLGYNGYRCQTIARDTFLGTWDATQSCDLSNASTNTQIYQTTIKPGPALEEVYFENFGGYNITVRAHLGIGGEPFIIDPQLFLNDSLEIYSASFNYIRNTREIFMQFVSKYNNNIDTCTVIFLKQ